MTKKSMFSVEAHDSRAPKSPYFSLLSRIRGHPWNAASYQLTD
jgi:hypothetical protein